MARSHQALHRCSSGGRALVRTRLENGYDVSSCEAESSICCATCSGVEVLREQSLDRVVDRRPYRRRQELVVIELEIFRFARHSLRSPGYSGRSPPLPRP